MKLPPSQIKNFLQVFKSDLHRISEEEDLTVDKAFGHLVLGYLGYDPGEGVYTDTAGDHGIDWWELSEDGAVIFQFKATTELDKIDAEKTVGTSELVDVYRIVDLLGHLPAVPKNASKGLRQLLSRLPHVMARYSETEPEEPFEITLYLAVLGNDFSDQAAGEWEVIGSSLPESIAACPVQITLQPLFMGRLLEERWKASNTEWRDITGRKRDKISLTNTKNQLITEPNSVVFYTLAHDLVRAFLDFGYQLFEPNVRCEIKNSKVNRAIKASVRSARGRREFKHLNNGITMICAGYQKGTQIRVTQPGIINGLQTVKAMSDAFEGLDADQKDHFKESCEVMVRLHTRQAVKDYRDLVKSTNTQNPMQSRNLRSNDPEQIAFERLFAKELGWFYERKEGAWLAFKSNPRLWGTLQGVHIQSFRIGGSRKYRTVDNMDIGQTWLAFLGYSSQAVHEKNSIFDDDGHYSVVFMHRPRNHGAERDYAFKSQELITDSLHSAPDPHLLLLSYFLRGTARHLIPSPQKNRAEAVSRLALEKKTKEDTDSALAQDYEYLENVIFRAWSFLFPEFVGYILFRVLGEDLYEVGRKLLDNGWLAKLREELDYGKFAKAVENEEFEEDDFLAVMWGLFRRCGAELIRSPWLDSWKQAPVRTRFNYSKETRSRLVHNLDRIDEWLKTDEIFRSWARPLNKHSGVFKYVESLLTS